MAAKKDSLTLTLEVDEHLSWGELLRFVALARQAGVHPEDGVLVTPAKDGPAGVFLTLVLSAEEPPDEG